MNEEKFISTLKNEILDLENQINNYESNYKKIKKLAKLKLLLIKTKMIAPFILTAAIVIEIGNLLNIGLPFVRDDINKHKETKKVFDSNNNVRYETFFHGEDNSNTIAYYKKENNNIWNVTVYNLKKFTEEEILELFDKNNINLQDLLGEPIKSYELENSKLNNIKEDFMEATTYDVDKNVYYKVKETIGENCDNTFAYIIFIMFSELFPWFLYDKNKEKNQEKICNLEDRCTYNHDDLINLEKKLEIKKDNYRYLTR